MDTALISLDADSHRAICGVRARRASARRPGSPPTT